ncbi:hypothetical protein Tco_1195429 [Tanacetum coccineum]
MNFLSSPHQTVPKKRSSDRASTSSLVKCGALIEDRYCHPTDHHHKPPSSSPPPTTTIPPTTKSPQQLLSVVVGVVCRWCGGVSMDFLVLAMVMVDGDDGGGGDEWMRGLRREVFGLKCSFSIQALKTSKELEKE